MGKIQCMANDATKVSTIRLVNILALFVTKALEVTQYSVTVANIGFTRSAGILKLDCKNYRCRKCTGEI